MEQFAKETLPVSLEAEMRHSYLDYAMSVIVGRALPDVRDGLKPVHRRVLFAMHESNTVWNRPYVKCARVVGDVLGKYHPHGDSATYEALVRMVQEFSLRYPLIDGQGNFGSVDGDGAAAYRYTECRLQKIAAEMLADIDRETVDFVPNYDGKEMEPSVLPARLPNLLVNGSSGIAVGMATNIPPHNLTEVVERLPGAARQPGDHRRRADRHRPGAGLSHAPGSSTGSRASAKATGRVAAASSSARARTSRSWTRGTGRRSSSTRSPTR